MLSFFVFVLLSFTVYVNSQVCQNASPYSACSSNTVCGCLPLSFSNSFGICGIVTPSSCSQLTRCESPGDTCGQPGYVCVRHSRCDNYPICYPMALANQTSCPLVQVSNYSSTLTYPDPKYTRPGSSSSNHYFEAIQLVVDRTGTYDIKSLSDMDTHGYIYNGTFYPSSPFQNQMYENDDGAANNQFRLPVTLEAGVPYTLVVTTHSNGQEGPFSVVTSGPGNVQYTQISTFQTITSTTTRPSIINSYYSGELTMNSSNYSRTGPPPTNYYYEAIEVTVNTAGNYTFSSTSGMDTYGYLYQGSFDPLNPSINHLAENDDGSGSQFQIAASLRAGITYILVLTTFGQRVTGPFRINVSGPDDVSLTPIDFL